MAGRKRLSRAAREAVHAMYGGRCAYCGTEIAYGDMQVDHREALRSGGEDSATNMLPACGSCNHYKRGNSLEGWRKMLEAIPSTLERDSYTYRQGLRFGLVEPRPRKIVFWFESHEPEA